MKAHAILAALVLAAPATSPAGHRGIIVGPGACLPSRSFGHYSHSYPHRYSHSYPHAYYAPRPFFNFSYISTPYLGTHYATSSPVYRATRYYGPAVASVEVDVQRALKRLGYYRGSLDGDIGPRSRTAIREYQADSGLGVTGRIDGSLLRSLGI